MLHVIMPNKDSTLDKWSLVGYKLLYCTCIVIVIFCLLEYIVYKLMNILFVLSFYVELLLGPPMRMLVDEQELYNKL